MSNTLVIAGLCGKVGSGKSTCCRLAVREFGAQMLSVVDPLKELAMQLYDLRREVVYGNYHVKKRVDPRYGVSPRVLLERLGDGLKNVIGDSVLVEPMLRRIDELYVIHNICYPHGKKCLVVVDSLRLPAEVEALRSLEGGKKMLAENVVTRIVKLVPVNLPDANVDQLQHSSEDAVDCIPGNMIDITIENDHLAGQGVLEATFSSWLREELNGIK